MRAIAKRELKAYFSSPIGYVCIGVLSALFGYYFYQVLLSGSTYYLSSVYNMMFMWGMMVIPLITMKSMSEDRKNRTDQMLLTSQVGLYSLVAGNGVCHWLGLEPISLPGDFLLRGSQLGDCVWQYPGVAAVCGRHDFYRYFLIQPDREPDHRRCQHVRRIDRVDGD